MVETARNLRDLSTLTEKLREETLITSNETALYTCSMMYNPSGVDRLDILTNDKAEQLQCGPFVSRELLHYPINSSHPISLMILGKRDEKISVGTAFYVPSKNTIFEFMTYVPV